MPRFASGCFLSVSSFAKIKYRARNGASSKDADCSPVSSWVTLKKLGRLSVNFLKAMEYPPTYLKLERRGSGFGNVSRGATVC